jgi:rhodanese-related sulfurtransferase
MVAPITLLVTESKFMARLIEFATNHPWLVSAFITVLLMLLWTLLKMATGNGLSPAQSVQLLNREGALPVDVRSEASYRAGHIINAVRVDPAQLDEGLKKLEKYKSKPLLVYCDVGSGSAKVVTQLRAAGYASVFQLQGGIAAWRTENLPLESSK